MAIIAKENLWNMDFYLYFCKRQTLIHFIIMKKILSITFLLFATTLFFSCHQTKDAKNETSSINSKNKEMKTIYDINVLTKKGEEVSLKQYEGKVLLIVNTASRCGFTPQYKELEAMYERLNSKGFEILDFPCNQFGEQAPGTDEEITQFCQLNYGTKFPQFKKIEVNGENQTPLYAFLKSQKGFEGFDMEDKLGPLLDQMMTKADPNYKENPDIKWNFTKFLINRKGEVVARFEPTHNMEDVEKQCEAEL